MATLSCKSCGGTEAAKSGFVRGLQRYRCRSCGCNFTNTPPRGKPAAMKAMAVLLSAMGNMSFGMIGRILGVSDVSVLRWVRAEAQALPEPAGQRRRTVPAHRPHRAAAAARVPEQRDARGRTSQRRRPRLERTTADR